MKKVNGEAAAARFESLLDRAAKALSTDELVFMIEYVVTSENRVPIREDYWMVEKALFAEHRRRRYNGESIPLDFLPERKQPAPAEAA